ncbi:MAG: hypothetical protein JHC93_08780, partial [Parachlamydiales bacterium]|nr:hypothetical protein [Parachlamydiales bacterium]
IGSGGFFCEEVDAIVDGPVPLVIRRFYNSLQENDHPVYGHWIFLPDSHLDQNTKDRTASVSDSCGMTLHYGCGHEGKYYVDAKDRNYIYNDSSGILSAKTFPINNFMEPHPELNEMHVFTCDGIKKIYKLNSSHKKESHYLLSESILTNGYRVFYTYDSENRVSQISNAYPSSKIFSWAKFTYAEDKLNYWIDLSDGRHLTYYNQTADEPNQYLLKHVDRTEGPIVNYEYMPKNPNGKPNIQEQSYNFYVHKRLKKIAYPDGRSLYNDYYTRSDFKERTVEHPCSGKIRSQQKPLNSDGSLVPVISYEYKHNHSKKNYYDIENMQVLTKDSNGLSTTYHLYKTHKPLAVELFDDHRKICRTEHIIYQEGHCSGNCTIGRFINDSKNTPIASKRWVSDPKGNVLQERNYGNITGTCAYEKISNEYSPPSSFVPPWQKEPLTLRNFSSLLKQYVGAIRFESQTITGGDCSIRNFSYSNDRFNNLLSETDEKGLTTHYTYIPDTILIKSIVVEACNVTYSKTVNDYDEENRLISTLITDGTDNSPQSLITKYEYANDRLITIAEGYLDTNKSYCQLKRISHEYDQYG